MDIWVPGKLYVFFPWICIIVATLSLLLEASVILYLCIFYLYVYSSVMLYKRNIFISAY
jgi:hypothetical protein